MQEKKKKLDPYQPPTKEYIDNLKLKIKQRHENRLEIIELEEVCLDCNGSGWFMTESKLTGGRFIKGELIPCNNKLHQPERLENLRRKMSGLNLSPSDMKLSINQLKPIHKKDKFETFQDYGKLLSLPESNLGMINMYKNILKDPLQNRLTYLLGGYGCGKTHWGKCLVKDIADKGQMITLYSTFHHLSEYLKEGYGDIKDSHSKRCDHIYDIDFLVIDEFDASECKILMSKYNINWLNNLVDKRIYAMDKVTIFIGNKAIEFAGYEAVNDRMKEVTRIYNTTGSFRGKNK